MVVVRQRAHEAERRLPQAHQYRIPFTAGGFEMTRTHARKTKTQKTACTAKKTSVSWFGVTGQFYTECFRYSMSYRVGFGTLFPRKDTCDAADENFPVV